MNEDRLKHPGGGSGTVAAAWVQAFELTAAIPRHQGRVFPTVIEECAAELGEALALLSDRECLTYRGLAERSHQYARWAATQ